MAKCFVIQPFDNGGPYDSRYDEVIEPSIKEAELDAYRVDRDLSVEIPIEEIEAGIKNSAVCLADISTNNPNVWYEVGFARARGKGLVLICSENREEKFPFDIQHRTIVRYGNESPSAFKKMGEEITARLKALAAKEAELDAIRVVEVIEETKDGGLSDAHVAALAVVLGNCPLPGDTISGRQVLNDMERAGYTKAMAGLSIRSLVKRGFLEATTEVDWNGNDYATIRLSETGSDWLLANEGRLKAREDSIIDYRGPKDDLPF